MTIDQLYKIYFNYVETPKCGWLNWECCHIDITKPNEPIESQPAISEIDTFKKHPANPYHLFYSDEDDYSHLQQIITQYDELWENNDVNGFNALLKQHVHEIITGT